MAIAVVFSLDFGERLWELARRGPVWIVNSTVNDSVIRDVRERSKESSEDFDVTSFRANLGIAPESELVGMLDAIDLHHPEWTALEVYGAVCDSEVREALESFGAVTTEEMPEYFVARRNL